MFGKKREPEKVGHDIYGVQSDWKTDQKLGKSAGTGFHHSSYFHKYFRGYTEVRTDKPGGGYRIERFYTQPWVIQDVSGQTYVLYRVIYALLFLVTVALFYRAAAMDGRAGNHSVLGAVGVVVSVVCLILLAAAVVNYCFIRRRMTLWDHQSSSGNLKKAALATAAAMTVSAVLIVVNCLFGVESIFSELQLAGSLLVPAVLSLTIYFLEKNVPYREEPNHTVLPEGEKHEIW